MLDVYEYCYYVNVGQSFVTAMDAIAEVCGRAPPVPLLSMTTYGQAVRCLF